MDLQSLLSRIKTILNFPLLPLGEVKITLWTMNSSDHVPYIRATMVPVVWTVATHHSNYRIVGVQVRIDWLSPVSPDLRGSSPFFIEVWQASTTVSQPSTKDHPELIPSDYLTH